MHHIASESNKQRYLMSRICNTDFKQNRQHTILWNRWSRGVYFKLRIPPRFRSQDRKGFNSCVKDLCRNDFYKNLKIRLNAMSFCLEVPVILHLYIIFEIYSSLRTTYLSKETSWPVISLRRISWAASSDPVSGSTVLTTFSTLGSKLLMPCTQLSHFVNQ